MSRYINLSLPDDLLNALRDRRERTGCKTAHFIRNAIRTALQAERDRPPATSFFVEPPDISALLAEHSSAHKPEGAKQ